MTGNSPPTLIVRNQDDERFILGCRLDHAALDEANVQSEYLLHTVRFKRGWPSVRAISKHGAVGLYQHRGPAR
jgi:hypothetical protein